MQAEDSDHLVANEYVYQSTQLLKRPGKLEEAAWQTSQRSSVSAGGR